MAGQNHLLTALARQLERLDDEAFAALASPGLLRRARKDLESHNPELLARDTDVLIRLAAHEVTLDARGPAHARCTCPSKTTCQHILAACLFVKSRSAGHESVDADAGKDAAESLKAELLEIALDALIRYAGKPAVRAALQALEEEEPAQCSFDKTILIRLTRPGVEFRYAGGGPDSLICDFRGRSAKKLAVQAILAFQRAHGIEHTLPGEAPKQEAAHALTPEMHELRVTVLAKVQRILRECIDIGLAHVSDALTERFSSLATVAEGAKFHRLSLALSRLSDRIDLTLERHALADSAALLAELAKTYALAHAMSDPLSWSRVDVVGESRSAYGETAALDLYCAGAYPWQTGSGYWGLTVLFWSMTQKRWFTYSDARPSGTLGFSPADAYRTTGPWRGCRSPAALMGHRLLLHHASVNRFGRLSGASSTTADVDAQPTAPPDFSDRAFRSWTELRAFAQSNLDGIGLIDRNPHADYVVLHPRRCLDRRFDGATQTLLWPIEDREGDELLLRLEYSSISAAAVERLDALRPEPNLAVLAQLDWSSGSLAARPLTLLRESKHMVGRIVDNLFLDEPPAASGAQALLGKLRAKLSARLPSGSSGAGSEGSSEPVLRPAGATERMLEELDELLLKIAERGAAAHAASARDFAKQVRRLHDCGLTLAETTEAIDADAILRARYLSQLTHECLARG